MNQTCLLIYVYIFFVIRILYGEWRMNFSLSHLQFFIIIIGLLRIMWNLINNVCQQWFIKYLWWWGNELYLLNLLISLSWSYYVGWLAHSLMLHGMVALFFFFFFFFFCYTKPWYIFFSLSGYPCLSPRPNLWCFHSLLQK